MGRRGPVPTHRPQNDEPVSGGSSNVLKGELELENEILGPEPPEWLDGYAQEWYGSLRISGQARYYTPSDWATAIVIARGIMDFIRFPKAVMLGGILQGATMLGATVGDRRRMQMDLSGTGADLDPDESAAQDAVNDWAKQLGGDVVPIRRNA